MKLNGNDGKSERKRPAKTANSSGASKEKKERTGKGRTAAAIVIIVVAVVLIGCAAGVIAVNRMTDVFPNVTVDGVEVGGMSELELAQALSDKGYDSVADKTVTVNLPMDYVLDVKAEQVCTNMSAADLADSVMAACHGGSNLENALTYVRCLFSGMELGSASGPKVDESAVRALVESAAREVDLKLMSAELTIGEDSIRVIKGANSITIDVDEICKLITTAFETENYAPIDYQAKINSDDSLDIDKLYNQVHCEPENARYDPETDTIIEEKLGLSFDQAQAKKLWNEAAYGDEVCIPLKTKQPEVTADSLRELLFRDCFISKQTSLSGSSANRINNVTKAAAAINDVVLMPGEQFSYNDTLGERTAANGYLPAGAYSGGQTVMEYGGGICQVSSTLYYCALYANLEITARTCHMFPVGYLPAGLDATVSWGGPEFKFVNNRDYPVRITSYVQDGSVTVEIWGTDVDGSYVEMTYATSYVYDTKYTDVAIGYRATTYRSVFDKDGNLISKKTEANSTYNYHKENIEFPEESPEVSPEVSPDASPEVSPENSPDTSPEQSAVPSPGVTDTPETTPTPSAPVTDTPQPTDAPAPTAEPTPAPTPDAPVATVDPASEVVG